MSTCPSCATVLSNSAPVCPRCGAGVEHVLTTLAPLAQTLPPPPDFTHTVDATRAFVPGTVLGKRYRIVAPLGRGGMGEVYRADDLKLGQPVALKFLPAGLAADKALQSRLVAEVRIARDVSHPNVCRVYDIHESDGEQFLAMEYVDGEDLASLLRRIGQLAPDKANDIGRQLCAGLSAIHEKGLLHRDLKPANVMLDGRGRVRVTDFGLAVHAADKRNPMEIAGTPAYMAPEQLEGRSLSPQTDLYALGLILFELFTGRKFFQADRQSSRRDQSDIDAVKRHASAATLDPTIERVVVRCLDPDPSHRPESALLVAAALPGGDPLQAALAAGETPSPAMVAAAGDHTVLPRGLALSLVLAVMVLLVPVAWLQTHDSAFTRITPPFSPDVLEFKAREIARNFGYADVHTYVATGFEVDRDYLRNQRERVSRSIWWNDLGTVSPSPVRFWVRLSPSPIAPLGANAVTATDPPGTGSGMKTITVDTRGRLISLAVNPSESEAALVPDVPWSSVFSAAGLDMLAFKITDSVVLPPTWADTRVAWTGPSPTAPASPLRVEAASYRGKPTLFSVVAAGDAKPRVLPGLRASHVVELVLLLGFLLIVGRMAQTNWRSGRGDKRGALLVAAFFACTQFAAFVLPASGLSQLTTHDFAMRHARESFALGGIVWALYLAMEPHIRRSWPESLISWNRLLQGRMSDGRIGNDILGGVSAQVVSGLLAGTLDTLSTVPRDLAGLRDEHWLASISARHTLASMLTTLSETVVFALILLWMFALAGLAPRRRWRSVVLLALFIAMVGAAIGTNFHGSVRDALLSGVFTSIRLIGVFVVLNWFGVVGLMGFLWTSLLLSNVVTVQPSAWYSGPSILQLGLIAALACYAYTRVARARYAVPTRGAMNL